MYFSSLNSVCAWYGMVVFFRLPKQALLPSLDVCFSFFNQNLAKVKASHTQVLEDMEKLNEELKKVFKREYHRTKQYTTKLQCFHLQLSMQCHFVRPIFLNICC